MSKIYTAIVCLITLFFLSIQAESGELQAFRKSRELSGQITSVGSDTMDPLMRRWGQLFQHSHPGMEFLIESKGSGTAAAALIEGYSQLAPMSRPMTANETKAFGARYGYAPIGVRVALDAVAVYVHRDNPVTGLTLEQLDGIFSSNQRCGGKRISKWKDISKQWKGDDSIMLVGRNKLSGTHDVFRANVLCQGDFATDYHEEPHSNNVIYKVATNPNAIGYAGIGYLTKTVKMVPLAKTTGEPFIPIQAEEQGMGVSYGAVTNGTYPLSRFLFIYINKKPGKAIAPEVEEFLRLVLSREGQSLVGTSGFIPMDENTASGQRAKLQAGFKKEWWESD